MPSWGYLLSRQRRCRSWTPVYVSRGRPRSINPIAVKLTGNGRGALSVQVRWLRHKYASATTRQGGSRDTGPFAETYPVFDPQTKVAKQSGGYGDILPALRLSVWSGEILILSKGVLKSGTLNLTGSTAGPRQSGRLVKCGFYYTLHTAHSLLFRTEPG